MQNKELLVNEIIDAHTMYYSLRGSEKVNFDINIDSIDSMDDKQLIQMLKVLKSLVNEELEKY